MTTIATYKSNGPYFPPTRGCYQAASLKDVLFHTRLAMEDGEQYIGAFDNEGKCYGLWEEDSEPESDGEGGWFMVGGNYLLRRPGGRMAGHFNFIANLLRGSNRESPW